jgi:SAM-dependent methyltransferase/uncharacterized protein YbaR (Trm112 family)
VTPLDPASLFSCPQCGGGDLKRVSVRRDHARPLERVRCDACGVTYPVRRGIPILLPDEAVRAVGAEAVRTGSAPAAPAPAERRERISLGPKRLRAAGRVLGNQGIGTFWRKALQGVRTEAERRIPPLRRGPEYSCPCCGARARFVSYRGRPQARCPSCDAKERERLLVLVLREILASGGYTTVLHAAPERSVRRYLSDRADAYVTVDLTRGLTSFAGRLTAAADLTRLPFVSDAFDLVLASHVLEHIRDDRSAIREVMRVLKPGGIAVLSVPIVHSGATVEYQEPHPDEDLHVRAPGLDYFGRYEEQGFRVVVRSSSDYPAEHQLRSYHAEWHGRSEGARANGVVVRDQYVPICLKPGASSTLSFDPTSYARDARCAPRGCLEARA